MVNVAVFLNPLGSLVKLQKINDERSDEFLVDNLQLSFTPYFILSMVVTMCFAVESMAPPSLGLGTRWRCEFIERLDVTPFVGPGLMRVGGWGHAAAPC